MKPEGPMSLAQRCFWCVVVLLGAWARFRGLGVQPLNQAEAQGAWAAWLASEGRDASALGLEPGAAWTLGLQWIGFVLGADGDAAARWPSALAGSLAPLAPLLARRTLGLPATLLAALWLALDPSWISLARRADGAAAAGTVGLALVMSFLGRETSQSRYLVAIGWGLLITCGAPGWLVLIINLLLLGGRATDGRTPWIAAATALVVASSGLFQRFGILALSHGATDLLRVAAHISAPPQAAVSIAVAAGIGVALVLQHRRDGPRWRAAVAVIALTVVCVSYRGGEKASGETRLVADDLERWSSHVMAHSGRPPLLEVIAEPRPDPALGWYLRHQSGITWVLAASRPEPGRHHAVVTPWPVYQPPPGAWRRAVYPMGPNGRYESRQPEENWAMWIASR